jgi:hypothetical protein
MNAKLKSYRAVVAEALTPRTVTASHGIVPMTEFRFDPSSESISRARAVGRQLSTIRSTAAAND